ncbi:MBL fold metallo-hydrolase [Aurantibacillus circumpalustris]|uniref:MBL fold metallo-hydrolase n=1 Tax=Aurantibacillus circumpalustris TaxID=3036359 RepID=UPI00295B52FE|nr:MBL fold metallo-hydrolase [Aurantibacillus circumpalustris]
MKIKFIGATEGVTGSKHLLITKKGREILLDCGLYQGMGKETDVLNRNLGLNASKVDAVILSHAHIDHSGSLPSLVKEGFKGKIYCTPATFDVCEILLLDSAHIHEGDVHYINKRRKKLGQPLIKPLYSIHDAEKCLQHFKPISFDTEFRLNDELSFKFTENGHIIGSATVNITAKEDDKITRLTFTGDIGRYKDPLLRAPSVFPQADYIICESTYGNRLHEKLEDSESKFLEIVKNTCVLKKGKLIIPAFSLGRTQEVLYILDKLKNKNLLPPIKIFVDSPLSTKATEIVRKHPESFNDELKHYITKDPDPFGFANLTYIENAEESVLLNDLKEPCVIISASGMGDAGRVKHHIKNTITNKRNTILFTGYCAPKTLGAKLISGEKEVHIYGETYPVVAEIQNIMSLSAHADYSEIIQFLSCQDKKEVKEIFLVHGEPDAKESFREKLLAENYKKISIPTKGSIDLV